VEIRETFGTLINDPLFGQKISHRIEECQSAIQNLCSHFALARLYMDLVKHPSVVIAEIKDCWHLSDEAVKNLVFSIATDLDPHFNNYPTLRLKNIWNSYTKLRSDHGGQVKFKSPKLALKKRRRYNEYRKS
jgi:hypothetical protein